MGKQIITGRRLIAIQMAERPFYGGKNFADVFVDCMNCDQSIGINNSSWISNDEAVQEFRKAGWTVVLGQKILCPACLALFSHPSPDKD